VQLSNTWIGEFGTQLAKDNC